MFLCMFFHFFIKVKNVFNVFFICKLINAFNYDTHVILVESSRVYLQPIRGIEGSDYINASFIDVS